MKTPTTSWVVVTVNGTSRPMTFRRAEAMAKALREGAHGPPEARGADGRSHPDGGSRGGGGLMGPATSGAAAPAVAAPELTFTESLFELANDIQRIGELSDIERRQQALDYALRILNAEERVRSLLAGLR